MLLFLCLCFRGFGVEPYQVSIKGNTFRILPVASHQLNLHWKNLEGQAYEGMYKLKKDLSKQGKKTIALMNAGIYSENATPAGLHVENGKVWKKLNTKTGYGNFHLQPNGVFLVTDSGHAEVLTTVAYQKFYAGKESTLKLATQSGPMLLIDGKINAKFIPDSQSKYTRNGVCKGIDDSLYFITTGAFPSVTSNLYEFAEVAKEIGCTDALYLDGSISKLYVSGEDAIFHFADYVGLLSVTTQ